MARVKSNERGWQGIWTYTGAPRAWAARHASNMPIDRSGAWSLYIAAPVALNTARPWRAAIASSSSTVFAPDASCTTPSGRAPMAPTSASSSERSVIVDGIGTPP